MEVKKFATGKFYMEAVMDGDQVVSLVGCLAEVEMVELNHLHITTPKTQMYLEIGVDVEWVSYLDKSDIPTIAELLDDYIIYQENTTEFGPTPPQLYLDEYEECTGTLPEPLKQYFLKLNEMHGPKITEEIK